MRKKLLETTGTIGIIDADYTEVFKVFSITLVSSISYS